MAKPRPEIVDWLADVFDPLGPITFGRLFGGWQFRCRGLAFAVTIEDRLYFRASPELQAALRAEGSEPFRYARGGRTISVPRFMSAPEGAMDDETALLDWAGRALAGAAAIEEPRRARSSGAGRWARVPKTITD